jgi:hypothetical protein
MASAKDLTYLCRALKAPSLLSAVPRLGERARKDNWTHEEFLAACLEREVASRQMHGGEQRVRAARFPAHKTLEDFDFEHQRSIRREVIAHLGALDFVAAKENVVFLGPPGTGKPISPSPWASVPARPATGSPSPPPPSGWRGSATHTPPAAFMMSSSGLAGTRSW